MQDSVTDNDDYCFLIEPPRRGGQLVYIKVDQQWVEVEIADDDTALDVKYQNGWETYHLTYKGATLHDDVCLAQLKSSYYELAWNHPGPVLRSQRYCMGASILCLVELLEWFHDGDDQYGEQDRDLPIIHAQRLWRSMTAWSHLRDKRSLRGGGKQGRLPWQSSRTIRGLKIATQIAVDGVPLAELVADEVCGQAKGVALMLLAGWPDLKGLEADGPLLVLFPGHCANVLKKMGASPARISEIEIVVEEPQDHTLLRRNATALSLSAHTYEYGHGVQAVAWGPQASADYSLELDTRYASELIVQSADQNWRALLKDLTGRMCLETISEDQFFSLRKSQQFPTIFSARIRLPPGAGEKLLCASGLEALFVRPMNPQSDPQSANFTIIWSSKHALASTQSLSDLLQTATRIAGHRGVARSLIGIGLRVLWKDVKTARQLLRPDDETLMDNNRGLVNNLYFTVDGIPLAASPVEITKFFGEVGWAIIPQSKISSRTTAAWVVTAQEKPKSWCFKWMESFVVVAVSDQEELRQRRAQQYKKRTKAAFQPKPEMVVPPKETSNLADIPDPLLAQDPWKSFAPKARLSTAQSSKPPATTSMNAHVSAPSQGDERIGAMMIRLDNLEKKNTVVEDRLDKLDTSVDNMGQAMTQQFASVMQGIKELQEMQKSASSAEPKPKRTAVQPFGS